MLIHVARTGCFESESYTVTPANFQIIANAHPPDSDLWSGGWDYSGSAHKKKEMCDSCRIYLFKEGMNMQVLKTFGECLGELMQKKHISVARLTERMNYRSKTSIMRMLRDEVRYASIEDFMKRLDLLEDCILNESEIQMLRNAMEVSRLGRTRYRMYQEIWRLMEEEKQGNASVNIKCFGETNFGTLKSLTRIWHEAKNIEMLIVNSGYDSLFEEIERLLSQHKNLECRIRHYIIMPDEPGSMAAQLGALMRVLHDARYQGYYRPMRKDGLSGEGGSDERHHIAAIRGETTDGNPFFQMLFFKDETEWLVYSNEQADNAFGYIQEVIKSICQDSLPIKTQYPRLELIEGLTAISRRYLNLERDRATYCLAPNICFELIALERLQQVMFDSALQGYNLQNEAVQELCRLHQARYDNVHNKKKPTVFIFSWDSLKHFAESGLTTDHVAGMRAFTVQERQMILRDVVEKCRRNGQLNVYILKPSLQVRGMTLTVHEDLGVYMLDSHTQYDVLNGHSEAFVVMPELVRVLETFFRDELIEKYTYPVEEGLQMLEMLAAAIEN